MFENEINMFNNMNIILLNWSYYFYKIQIKAYVGFEPTFSTQRKIKCSTD